MSRHILRLLGASLLLSACGPKAAPPSAGEPVAAVETAPVEPAAPAWDDRRRDEQMGSALGLLATGQVSDAKRALEMLGEVGQQEPDLAEVPYNQGVAWLVIGDSEQARKRFLRATDIDPSMAEAWQNLGALSEASGQLDRALKSYRSGLRYAPENAPLLGAEIRVLRQSRQYDQALRKAKAAIESDSNNVEAYNQLGLVYLETGKIELAQFIYNRAIEIVPPASTDPHMHANLARVYLAQDRKGLARKELTRALELDPNLTLARLYVAEMAMDDRDYETVVATLEPTLVDAGDDPAIHMNLGIGYRGVGRLEDAKKSYEKALELNPSDPAPYLNLAALVGDHFKDYDQAMGLLDTYERQGGTQAATVSAWREDFTKQKKRLEIEARRKKRREEADERRKAAAAAERRAAEAKAKEAAAAPPPPPPAQPDAATPAPADAPSAATPPAAVPTPSADPPPAPEPPPAADPPTAPPPAAPPPSAASAGQGCSALGACGDGFECAQDGVCRPDSAPGTYEAGVGCFQDADCAYGLSCSSSQCAAGAASDDADSSPWGN